MDKQLFNGFTLTNQEIEKIILKFDKQIKTAVKKTSGSLNQDYEQIIRMEIFKRLSKNRDK